MKPFLKISIIVLPLLIFLALCLALIMQRSNHSSSVGTTEMKIKSKQTMAIAPSASTIIVMIGGDIMLDRGNRAFGETNGYDSLFAGIAPLFHSADISIANLEGSITDYPSKTFLSDSSFGKDLIFTFATSTAPVLKRAGLTAVSLANNHTGNFGIDGIDQTHHWLE